MIKSNEIDPNWILISSANNELFENYYLAVYINNRDLLRDLRSIRDGIGSKDSFDTSGKITLLPKNESFNISILSGKTLDMIEYVKDRDSQVKSSKIRLVRSNSLNCKFFAEYDVETKDICFKYVDYHQINPSRSFRSNYFKLDEIIELINNKFKYENSR